MMRRFIPWVRNGHIAAALYNIVYVYTPLHAAAWSFATVRYGSLPILMATGYVLVRQRKKSCSVSRG